MSEVEPAKLVNENPFQKIIRTRPVRSQQKLVHFGIKRSFLSFYIYLQDAARFYPWEVVSSYELAPKSFFFLKKDNSIRKPLIRLIRWKLFDWTMLAVILANCVTLAMASNEPGFDQTPTGKALSRSNVVFVAIFIFEAVCKITALGFALAPHTYLRNGWNVLDFVVVCMGVLELTSFGNYTFIRCFRALRPLRAVTKIESLKVIVSCLMRSLPMLGDVVILALFYFAIFGIACLELFKGQFYNRCGAPDFSKSYSVNVSGVEIIQNVSYIVSNTVQICKGPLGDAESWYYASGTPELVTPFSYEGEASWGYACPAYPSDNPTDPNYPSGLFCVYYGNPDVGGYRNFDNIFISWVQIFQHLSCQDWSYIMYATQASLSWWTWLLHVTMVLIGGYLIVNLTLAVIFINFTSHYSAAKSSVSHVSLSPSLIMKRDATMEQDEAGLASKDLEDGGSKLSMASSRLMNYPLVATPTHGSRAGCIGRSWEWTRDICYIIQDTKTFQHTTTAMILLNAVTLAITWYNMPDSVATATQDANYFFTMYFFAEMVIKITGLGPHAYVSDNFNIFDAVVTLIGVAEMAIVLAPNVTITGAMSVFRAFRLLRIFRLARAWKSLNRIIKVLLSSLLAVSWLTVLMFLFLFIAGLLGMTFFGYKLDSCSAIPGAVQLCPPGLTFEDCPSHFYCYVQCNESQALAWFPAPSSPYGGNAFCEVFPREYSMLFASSAMNETRKYTDLVANGTIEFWAQVGKPTTFMPNFDNIYQAMLNSFIMLTQDNWDYNMKNVMVLYGSPWLPALFTIITMIIGIYTVLNLFLAILLSNLEQLVEDKTSGTQSEVGSAMGDRAAELEDVAPVTSGPSKLKPSGRQQSLNQTSMHIMDKITPVAASMWVPKDLQNKMMANLMRLQQSDCRSSKAEMQRTPPAEFGDSCYVKKSVRDLELSAHGHNMHDSFQSGQKSYKSNMVVPLPPILGVSLEPLDPEAYHHPMRTSPESIMQLHGSHNLLDVNRVMSKGGEFSRTASRPGELNRTMSRATSRTWLRSNSVMHDDPNRPAVATPVHPDDVLEGRSLYLFSKENKLRMLLAKVVNNSKFEFFMLFLIVLSSLQLCFDDVTVRPGSPKYQVLRAFDIFFCITFGIEAVMKILAFGLLFNGRNSYLRRPWNILDIFIVIVGAMVLVLESILDPSDIIWLRAFRAMRALRPLRVATHMDGVRVVVLAMFKAIPAIGEIFLVGSLFYYIFAVLGVNLMSGLFNGCISGGNFLDPTYLVDNGNINQTWCESDNGFHNITSSYYHSSINVTVPEWYVQSSWGANNILQRFDNVIMALWSLFQVSSLENWSPIMIQAMDCTSLGDQPLFNANVYMSLYFVVFVILCVFFILNMVIGVSINEFNKLRDENGGSFLLTEKQQEWLTVQRMMSSTKPKRKYIVPRNIIRKKVFQLVMSKIFDHFIIAVILSNVLVMFMSHEGESNEWTLALNAANAGFTGIFVAEMILKLLAMGVKSYFTDGWCQFDVVVVAVSVAGVVADYAASSNLSILPLLRVLRVLRIIKLVPKAKGLKMMMLTLLWSMPALLNVATVLLLFMFVYAIIGMNILGNIKWQSNIDNDANFQSFPSAMLLLFRMQTGENWDYVMTDCMVLNNCQQVVETYNLTIPDMNETITLWAGTYLDNDENSTILSLLPKYVVLNRCSPSPTVAALYFCTYMMVCVYLVVQLIIGVIIENIILLQKIHKMQVSEKHIQAFVETWEELDTDGSGLIDATHLTVILMAVDPPMGVKGLDRAHKRIQEIAQQADIPLRGAKMHFLEALYSLAGRVVGENLPADEEFMIRDRLVKRLPKDEITPKFNVGDYYAALYVKSSIKGYIIRAKLKPLFDEYETTVLKQKGESPDSWRDSPLDSSLEGGGLGAGIDHTFLMGGEDNSARRFQPRLVMSRKEREEVLLSTMQGSGVDSSRSNGSVRSYGAGGGGGSTAGDSLRAAEGGQLESPFSQFSRHSAISAERDLEGIDEKPDEAELRGMAEEDSTEKFQCWGDVLSPKQEPITSGSCESVTTCVKNPAGLSHTLQQHDIVENTSSSGVLPSDAGSGFIMISEAGADEGDNPAGLSAMLKHVDGELTSQQSLSSVKPPSGPSAPPQEVTDHVHPMTNTPHVDQVMRISSAGHVSGSTLRHRNSTTGTTD